MLVGSKTQKEGDKPDFRIAGDVSDQRKGADPHRNSRSREQRIHLNRQGNKTRSQLGTQERVIS